MRLALILVMAAAATLRAADVYVSPHGSDTDTGDSPRRAWRSLDRLNRHVRDHGVAPGDSIRLRAGTIHRGSIVLNHATGGTSNQPVLITSYGRGRAWINAGSGNGILIRETPWVTVSNLDVIAGKANLGDGIRCDRDHDGSQRIAGIRVVDCAFTGFGWHGIMVDATQRTNGFEHVRIERCVARQNRHAGIMVYGGNQTGRHQRPHADVVVTECMARDNPGDPDELQHHSGSGILLDGVDGGAVRRCVASGNGAECRSDRGGPVGIWTHASRRVTIERCESFANQSLLRDGGGFDIDGGCEECVLRWNFSHDNHGPGFLVYTYAGAAYADFGCRVQGNVSFQDGAPGTGYGGIQVGSESGCRLRGLEVSGNTVIGPKSTVGSLRIGGESIEAHVHGNLIVVPAHGVLVSFSGHRHRVRFERNHYWRPDGKPVFLVDSQWTVPSLASWRHPDGVETRFNADGEEFSDPMIQGIPAGIPSHRGFNAPRWLSLRHRLPRECGAPAYLSDSSAVEVSF